MRFAGRHPTASGCEQNRSWNPSFTFLSRRTVVGVLVIATILRVCAISTVEHGPYDPCTQGAQLVSCSPGYLSLRVPGAYDYQNTIYLPAEYRRVGNHEHRGGIENNHVEPVQQRVELFSQRRP